MRLYGLWQIFRIQGGWPMSDNGIFQGGSDPRGHSMKHKIFNETQNFNSH